jgi:hypothetical protein
MDVEEGVALKEALELWMVVGRIRRVIQRM